MEKILQEIEGIYGFTFEPVRRNILCDIENSFQVQACPGSGKTTLLVAKLMLIAQVVDFDNDSICVLTHTNVAIHEIKRKIHKLKTHQNQKFVDNLLKLFNYPNFIGTTQSFLDRYLGIPSYIKVYGYRPNCINEEIKNGYIANHLRRLSKDTWELAMMIPVKGGKPKFDPNTGYERLKSMCYCAHDDTLVYLNPQYQINLKSKENPKYQDLLSFKKEQVINNRILGFKEMDYFSLKYLNESANIRKILQERFKYVLIDEIQDTSSLHIQILNKIFEGGNNIIQGFGDYNQEIIEEERTEHFRIFGDGPVKSIEDSQRLSSLIARNVSNISIRPQTLKGIDREPLIPMYCILFDPKNAEAVIPEYQKIIDELSENGSFNEISEDKRIFKAVGWVHSDKTKGLTIGNYWNEYDNGSKKKTRNILYSYFLKVDREIYKKNGYRIYKELILDGFIHALNHNKDNQIKRLDGKSFSRSTLIEYLKQNDLYNEFTTRLLLWIQAIEKDELNWNEVKDYFLSIEINGKRLIDGKFFQEGVSGSLIGGSPDNTIGCIKISTIHSVKGETHTGTLLLDTIYHQYEHNGRIFEFWNKNTEFTEGGNKAKGLKVNYVGLTRATHLLCIAISTDHWKDEYEKIISSEIIMRRI